MTLIHIAFSSSPSPLGAADMTKEQINALDTETLFAILRSTNAMTERFCNELTWAKAELRRRGFAVN